MSNVDSGGGPAAPPPSDPTPQPQRATVRDAPMRAVAANPDIRELLARVRPDDPDPAPTSTPESLARFPLPPRLHLIDRLVRLLRPHRPAPPVYADPDPHPPIASDIPLDTALPR